MSIWKNGKLVAGGRQATPLLSFMWADHILDDISWLRADTFSWQSGSVYQAVYQHLANDIDGKSLQSETVGGTTIQFYLADDGHKICPESEMSNVAAIYAATGVAWYYIIDTVNERFKLPRTKFGFTGLRDNVGKYVEPGLPNITGGFRNDGNKNNNSGLIWGTSGAFSATSQSSIAVYTPSSSATVSTAKISFDASGSNSIYGNSTTVQPPATQMYLYFYVGAFTQTALENTAGVVTEDFNELNAHKVIEFQAPTAQNNYTWYRKYADGWVEQGGVVVLENINTRYTGITVHLPITMADTNYTATGTAASINNISTVICCIGLTETGTTITKTTSSFWLGFERLYENTASKSVGGSWRVEGMAA